jgi:O-succinylbenzoate synthase
MRLQFAPYVLKFKEPAGTSRGVLTEKITCFLRLFDEKNPARYGVGEAGIFPGLSPEADNRFFYKLMELQANVRLGIKTDLTGFPSLQCGFEQVIRDYAGGCKGLYYDTPFTHGEESIEINGLVWMGNKEEMMERLERKLSEGFHCVKLKIGAIDWRSEVEMVEAIRERYDRDHIEIRVDANGGFTMDNAIPRLHRLAQLDVHSIEQPIKAGNPELMRFLCDISPLPIALDEELIGKFTREQKIEMLDTIKPSYIVIKPTLAGGFSGGEEWIALAEERGIGWWITSSLESNIGLNALAQWVSSLHTEMPQGLGTGALYTNNADAPIYLKGDRLHYRAKGKLDYGWLNKLDWRE